MQSLLLPRFRFRPLALFLLFSAFTFLIGCGRGVTYRTVNHYAMGTYVTFTVESAAQEDGDASAALASLLTETEALLSHRMEGSFAASLNQNGKASADGRLVEALRLAEEVKEKTDGLFSVSVLPLTALWDFDAPNPVPPTGEALQAALSRVKNSALVFENGVVSRVGGEVDLGALGKGYACDVLADELRTRKESGLISVGGSIAAVGSKNGDVWRIGVRDPYSDARNDTLGTLLLTDAFVSTSGSYEKAFTYEGKTYHHILDPETGMPAESDLLSVSVVAKGGTLSDILSTACFLVGSDAAFALAAEYDAAVVAVKTDGTLLVSASLSESFLPTDGWEVVYR